tara:strand:- start:16 stop:1530 length:1515 start_codon:yes stop_codon:yes gene_type:complete
MSSIIRHQSTIKQLYKDAIKWFGCKQTSTGALAAYSGKFTGRQPQWKKIVKDDSTKDIWWGTVNKEISPFEFQEAKTKAINNIYSNQNARLKPNPNIIYNQDYQINWNDDFKYNIRLHSNNPYHVLFLKNMTIDVPRLNDSDININIYDSSNIFYKDQNENNEEEGLIALNFTSNEFVIFGTEYAGELKKGLFTYMMYKSPLVNALPMHSSANIGKDNDITVFFGLSGTGKTTLSTESNRKMIGDDEHVWYKDGIFNIEGGCYAKCKDLSKDNEPEIVDAIKYGSILENVVLDENNDVDFKDTSITENTRCSYPLEHLENVKIPATSDRHPRNIILLCCDAFGILPPLAKLTNEQATYFFINGYTSKVSGTEMGITEPQVTFSACFGQPFLVHHPLKYGKLLKEYLSKYKSNVWLLNTGWIEGDYKTGRRIPIKYSREMINSIHNESLKDEVYENFPLFNIKVPIKCGNIPINILHPKQDISKIEDLYKKFQDNYNNLHNTSKL